MSTPPSQPARPAPLGWRLLALVYDAIPNLALWIAISAVALALTPGHVPFAPWSPGQWLLWGGCWMVSGLYAVVSWHRGGQTLGMRPWRLKVVASDGSRASAGALARRYALATLSVLVFGLGFAWCLFDRQHRAWHDRVSGTLLVRLDA